MFGVRAEIFGICPALIAVAVGIWAVLATEAPPPAQSPEAPPPAQSLRVQLPVPVPNRHLGASGPGACLLCAAASPVFAPVSTSVPVAPACTVPSDVAQGPESPAQVKVSALIQLVLFRPKWQPSSPPMLSR